jgi:7,8-dihydroneopterin aldolase/epimerase/oxygenase
VSGPLVEIRGLRVFTFHGVLAEERASGQEFVLDVTLQCRPTRAARTDEIADAVNYAEVCERVVELARGGPYNLIETLATLIAEDLTERFAVESATVRIAKPDAPIPHPFAEVAVTVTHRC